MNTDTKTTIEESLKKLVNTHVVVKFTNGRVISGTLKESNNSYSIKLGTLHIPVTADTLAKPAIAYT